MREAAAKLDDEQPDPMQRGSSTALLPAEHDVALLGPAPWLAPDALTALADLVRKRAAAPIASLTPAVEVTVSVRTPGGNWWPSVVVDQHHMLICARPVDEDSDGSFDTLVGAPVFLADTTVPSLAGFLHRDHGGRLAVSRGWLRALIPANQRDKPARDVRACADWNAGDDG